MILINLLESRRKPARRPVNASLMTFVAGGLAAGVVLSTIAWWALTLAADQQGRRNQLLREGAAQAREQAREVKTLRAEIASLQSRQSTVERLTVLRGTPTALLSEMALQTPDGVSLTAVRQNEESILIAGLARSNERVSELMRRLQESAQAVHSPELIEVRLVSPAGARGPAGGAAPEGLYEFSIRVALGLRRGAGS